MKTVMIRFFALQIYRSRRKNENADRVIMVILLL